MRVALINPNLVVQRNDPFTTGIVYLPVSLAYVAAALRAGGVDVAVIDAFGEQPTEVRRNGQFNVFGLTPQAVVERLPASTDAVIVYAINLTNHLSTIDIVRHVKAAHPSTPVIVRPATIAFTIASSVACAVA